MSFAICRLQKLKGASAVAGVQIHNRRERENSNTNHDIDRNRSGDNYTLADTPGRSYNALADERIKQGYKKTKAIRKDAVRVVEGLFTSDGEFFRDKSVAVQRHFFEDCLKWARERFGADNIIAATVHMDEATPHLHVDFVPLTADGRLAANEILGGKVVLQKMQDDFYEKVGNPWGMERGSRADLADPQAPKPRKHEDTLDFKRKTLFNLEKEISEKKEIFEKLIRDNEDMALRASQTRVELSELEREVKSLSENKTQTKGDLEGLQREYKERRAELLQKLDKLYQKIEAERAEKEKNLLRETSAHGKTTTMLNELSHPESLRKVIGGVKMSAEDFKTLSAAAVNCYVAQNEAERLRNEVRELKNSYYGERHIALNAAYNRLIKEKSALLYETRELTEEISQKDSLIDKTRKYLLQKKLTAECNAFIREISEKEQEHIHRHSQGFSR